MKAKLDDFEFHFDHLYQLVQHESYHAFTYLNLNDAHLHTLPSPLPPNLQILLFDKNHVTELPGPTRMPATLRILSGRSNPIRELPDLSHCTELESIDLFDTNILHVGHALPPNLRSLNLSYSLVKSIDYSVFPDTLRHCCLSYCFLTEAPPPKYRTIVQFDHNNIPNQMYTSKYTSTHVHDIPQVLVPRYPNGPAQPYAPERTHAHPYPYTDTVTVVYQDPQNVHAPSIQSSVNQSLQYVLSYPLSNPPRDHIKEVTQLFVNAQKSKSQRPRRWWHWLTQPFSSRHPLPPPIEAWCQDKTLHSIHGVTFNRLLARVWAIIQDHEHREAMEQILQEELLAGRGMCFTGRFSRVLNSLNGFVSEVRVGISDKEQMQNQIGAAIHRYQNSRKPSSQIQSSPPSSKRDALTKEIQGILEEFKVPSEEQAAWLAPLEDLF